MRLLLAATFLLGLAAPAVAYPTSIVNVPTAGVTPFKAYHFGTYHYVQPSVIPTPNSPYLGMVSLSAGVSPYFDLSPGIAAGAIEVGVDFMYPFPMDNGLYPSLVKPGADESPPVPILPHLKIGLLQESDVMPGLAIGGYYFGLPSLDYSANVLHATLTKTLSFQDLDLGQVTLGAYHGNPLAFGSSSNGWMAGYFHHLPINAYLAGDYTSGDSQVGGANVSMGTSLNRNVSVTAGYFFATRGRNDDKGFLFIDWIGDLPM